MQLLALTSESRQSLINHYIDCAIADQQHTIRPHPPNLALTEPRFEQLQARIAQAWELKATISLPQAIAQTWQIKIKQRETKS